VLAATKPKVLKRQAELKGKGLQDLDAQLRRASGFAFYNTSRYDFKKIIASGARVSFGPSTIHAADNRTISSLTWSSHGKVLLLSHQRLNSGWWPPGGYHRERPARK
jgi:hypothetical protein